MDDATLTRRVLARPCSCPNCGSPNVEGGPIDVDGPCATQEVCCPDCDGSWTEEYALSGARGFEAGTVPEGGIA